MPRRPLAGRPARWIVLTLVGATSAVACAPPIPHPAPADVRSTYVTTLGDDTLSIEQFTRTPREVVGDLLIRQPSTALAHYVVALDAAGRPTRVDYTVHRPDGSPLPNAPRAVSMVFRGDSVIREVTRDTVVRTAIFAPGAYPMIGNSVALTEIALAGLRASKRDSASVSLIGLGAPRPTSMPMRLVGADTARLWYFGDPQIVRLNARGHLLSLDASQTTNKIQILPVSSVDLIAVGNDFWARERAGMGVAATTRDTVNASVGGATLWIDYGRPLARGRTLFTGTGVLGDTIWRTGANAATQFRTDRDLVIGGQPVPAGTYTLWTHAVPGNYQLIINKQTGQWGTEYHPDRDLVRVPLTATTLATPVERFTITAEPQGANGGTLALRWGTMQLSTPFTVR